MSRKSNYIIAPGETICELLETNNITQMDLSSKLGLTTKTINEIIKGKAPITTETALKLEYVFGLPASFWNNLESNYREKLLRQKEYSDLRKETEYLSDIPYCEMAKRNWVEKTKDPIEKVVNLRRFFSVASLSFNTELKNKMAFRKNDDMKFSFNALYCWIRYGEKKAILNNNIEDFNLELLKKSVTEIRKLATQPFMNVFEQIKNILSSCGVSLIFEPCLPNTHVNGVAYKMAPNKALLMLSGRNKRDDSLWFTFFHEIGHLTKHSKKEIFIDYDMDDKDLIEAEADKYAREILIPEEEYKKFVENNIINELSILSFAKKIDVNPGIVVGRLQIDNKINWNQYSNLKVVIK